MRSGTLFGGLMLVTALVRGGLAGPPEYFRQDAGVSPARVEIPFELADRQLVWRQALQSGQSTPCVSEGKVFLTTYDSQTKELATLALDSQTGRVIWKNVAPATKIEPFHPTGSPAASSPACDGERVYVFFGSYGLLCYDLDGKLLWQRKMGPFQDEFGASSSPILVDGKVILNEDHDKDSFLIAVDQKSGEVVWKTPRTGFTRSYSTPVVWNVDGRPQIVVAGSLQLAGYDVNNGKKIWWINGLSRIVDTTPVVTPSRLYLATWTPGGDQTERISMGPFEKAAQQYDENGDGKIAQDELPQGPVLQRFFRIDLNQDKALDKAEWEKHARVFELAQNVAISVRPGGKGNVTDSHVEWSYRRGLPTVPSPLVYQDVMYMVKDGGIVTSLDTRNGKLLRQGRARGPGPYYASPVAAAGKVFLAIERGVVTVVDAGRQWQTVASRDFKERIMATPVIRGNRIYLRTDEALYCFAKDP